MSGGAFDKIFNVGLNRAGTSSLTQALRILGFRAAHHRVGERRIVDLVNENAQANRRLLQGLDDHYDAFSDFAASRFVATLDRQYPNSRFILTLRDLDGWLDSRERKVMKNRADPNYRHGFLTVNRAAWTRGRTAYLAWLDEYFAGREQDLLRIDIPAGDGWEPLCRFLHRPVPSLPFPWLNRLAGG